MEIRTINVNQSPVIEHKAFQIKVFLISFFLIYFGTAIIDSYFLIYLPLLYFRILEINVSLLTIVQLGIYSTLLLTPICGLVFDKFIHKRYLMVISIICTLISFSFFCFAFTLANLGIYVLFSIIYFISQALLRGCMSKTFFKVLSKVNDKKSQNNFLVVANSSTITAYLLISITFNLTIVNINNLTDWNLFLIIGSFLVLIILIAPILMKYTNFKDITNDTDLMKEIQKHREEDLSQIKSTFSTKMVFVPMLLIYITGFLSSSDQIFSYPFSSWILADFGIINFRIFTTFYSCFQILTLLGYIIFQKLLNFKLKHLGNTKNSSYRKEQAYNLFRKRILIINTFSFSLLYLIFTAVDFLPFMVCYCLFSLLAGIYNISLTSFSIDFSRRLKNQSFFYLLLGTYFSLAQFTLKPLGILLTSSISVENLMIITSILTLISIIPLWYTKLPTQENSYNK